MLFNSWLFLGFFLCVYPVYLVLRRRRGSQNVVLLVASYVFYGTWDWRFLFLLGSQTVVDFVGARYLDSITEPRRRKAILALLVGSNLAVLAFFKYFNFFSESGARLISALGFRVDAFTLGIVLPVGISFYTFHELSYLIDVYRRHVPAARRFVDYAVFVAFFPLLVAGPIARAGHLLPQLQRPRFISRDHVSAGLFLILWGYYKKVVVADNVAPIADRIFNGYQQHGGLDLLIGMLAFTVQIYGDFSGYSDIARGLAHLMGFSVNLNFRLPYFAVSPSDFWTRWHISLSSWLRDYLYVPLGGSRGARLLTYRNLALTMLLGGLWHGAAWHFVLWGAFHGTILILYRLAEEYRGGPAAGRRGPGARAVAMAVMFALTVVGWVLFRSTSVEQSVSMLRRVGLRPSSLSGELGGDLAFYSLPLFLVQVAQHRTRDLLVLTRLPWAWRILVYAFLAVSVAVLGARQTGEFIYFQF